jgi:hypothetical protein
MSLLFAPSGGIQIDPRPVCPACKMGMALVSSTPTADAASLDARTFKCEICSHVAHMKVDRWSGEVSPSDAAV